MPLYDYKCDKCGTIREVVQLGDKEPICCGISMRRKIGLPAYIRIKGEGYPSRRKWMDNWTPESPPFKVVPEDGEI